VRRPAQQQPAPSPHSQLSQNIATLTSAAAILRRASFGWSFSFVELWLPAMDRKQLLFDADTCAINPHAPQDAMSVFRDSSKTFTFKKGFGIPGRVWETMRPELRTNVQSLNANTFHRKTLSIATGLQGVVAWPVVSSGMLLGVLCAFFDHPLGGNQNAEIADVKQIQHVAQMLGDALKQEAELRSALGLTMDSEEPAQKDGESVELPLAVPNTQMHDEAMQEPARGPSRGPSPLAPSLAQLFSGLTEGLGSMPHGFPSSDLLDTSELGL